MLVRELLVKRLGPEFAHSATHNKDGYVSAKVSSSQGAQAQTTNDTCVQVLRSLKFDPSASELDAYLLKISRSFGIDWEPQLSAEEK